MGPRDFSEAARAKIKDLVARSTAERTTYRYKKLVDDIRRAAPNEEEGVSAFSVYLGTRPTAEVARVALCAYKKELSAQGIDLGHEEKIIRRAILGLDHGPAQQERHAITEEEAAKVIEACKGKRQGQMYQQGFKVAFAAALRHQQLAKLSTNHFKRDQEGRLSIVFQDGLKGPRPPRGVRPPEVHKVPRWATAFFEGLIEDREGLLFPTWSTGRANEIIKQALGATDADGRPIVMHSFKHGAAVNAAARGKSVCARTGHRSSESVARYSRENAERRPGRPPARRRQRDDDDD